MAIPTKDTVAAITERIERSNNGYTMTYDRTAVDACANTGKFEIRPFRNSDGNIYWTVKKRPGLDFWLGLCDNVVRTELGNNKSETI